MAETGVTYQAIVGLDFDALKPPVRVDSGAYLPKKVPASDIKWLLEQRLIRELPAQPESEGEK